MNTSDLDMLIGAIESATVELRRVAESLEAINERERQKTL